MQAVSITRSDSGMDGKDKCCCKNKYRDKMLKIVRGNDFTLNLALTRQSGADRYDSYDLTGWTPSVKIINSKTKEETIVTFTVSDNIISVPVDGELLEVGTYDIEVVMVNGEQDARSYACKQFAIVETNAEAYLPRWVEFGDYDSSIIHMPMLVQVGLSAYEIALKHGFSGSEEEWLASLKGETGAAGPANTLSIGTVVSGTTAAASISDTAPNQTLNLVLPQGPAGQDGQDGAAATIEIGTVTTGAAGTSASVENVGTSSAARLNFVIPQGAQGANGTDGVGIASVTQTTTSTESGGTNVITVTKTDGTEYNFNIKNGSRGKSAYQVAVDNGYEGTEEEFVSILEQTADEEDITVNASNRYQLKDRIYNAQQPNGMGYVILRRDKTFAEQVVLLNTIYEIRYNFDLNGGTVNIPSGCTLRFNGGAVSNGSIVYNNTEIQGAPIVSCTCTGSLRNTVVTPQMYGAKADGVTDDQVALNNAAKYNDSVFIPAGEYNVTEPITLKSNNTLFGVGRESKIRNSVVTGYNKFCVFTGGMAVGTAADSYLTLPSYACVVSADRLSLEMSDTSPFHVGDLIFVYKDETYSEKNPPHYWNAKIVGITTNESIKLDYYMGNDDLVGVNCLAKNMTNLPQGSGHYPNVITENVCIHDLTLENIVDDGSGMYVMAIGSYGADIYNIWSHGNTIIGTNYCVNASFRNIVGEFDGSFIDCPEVNQNVEVAGCRVKRFGRRQNVIGMTFLQGYKAFVHDNRIDFGGAGKVGFGEHIRPVIKNNVFDNCLGSGSRSIDLSSYGECIFTGNRVSTTDTNAIIDLKNSTGNIVCDNYFVNPNIVRWVQAFSSLDFGKNAIKNNYATKQTISDAYYYRLPNTTIGTFLPHVAEVGSRTIAAGATYQAFAAPKLIYNARAVKISILLSKGNYSVKFTSSAASANTRTITLTNATWLEVYIFASSNYLNFKKDGDDAGAGRAAFNNHGRLAAIDITNNDQTDASLYTCLIEDIVP